jgi:hypothetical protein
MRPNVPASPTGALAQARQLRAAIYFGEVPATIRSDFCLLRV